MSRSFTEAMLGSSRVPRASGDEPTTGGLPEALVTCSPRERG